MKRIERAGRDLDEAVAKAFGCKWPRDGDPKCTLCGGHDPLIWCAARCGTWPDLQPRPYSTDVKTQDEKLEWLLSCAVISKVGQWVSRLREIRLFRTSVDCAEPWRAEAIGLCPDSTAHGSSIDEALARLIVEVAKVKHG